MVCVVSEMGMCVPAGRASHLRPLGGRGAGRERADSLSSRAASLCLAKGPLHPGGRIYVLVFYGSRAGHHGFSDKIFVNSKSLREGGEFRDLLQPPDQSRNHLFSPQ